MVYMTRFAHPPLETESRHDANFVVFGGIGGQSSGANEDGFGNMLTLGFQWLTRVIHLKMRNKNSRAINSSGDVAFLCTELLAADKGSDGTAPQFTAINHAELPAAGIWIFDTCWDPPSSLITACNCLISSRASVHWPAKHMLDSFAFVLSAFCSLAPFGSHSKTRQS